jgi:hypothetical protein
MLPVPYQYQKLCPILFDSRRCRVGQGAAFNRLFYFCRGMFWKDRTVAEWDGGGVQPAEVG